MKKKIFMLIVLWIIMFFEIFFVYEEFIKKPELIISRDTYEYGETIDFNNIILNKDVALLEIGEFDYGTIGIKEIPIVFQKGFRKYEDILILKIKDDNKPILKFKNDIVYIEIGKEYDPSTNIETCLDIIDGTLEYEIIENIDTNTLGENKVTIITKDKNENKVSKNFIVIITEELENTKLEKEELNLSTTPYLHTINADNITPYIYKYNRTEEIIESVLNDKNIFYAQENNQNTLMYSLVEVREYSTYKANVLYKQDDAGNYYKCFVKEDLSKLKEAIIERQKQDEEYRNSIIKIIKNMNLNTTDKELIEQINEYIINNFTYEITDELNMNNFLKDKKGQCIHFAQLFKNLCEAVNIECYYISGDAGGGHAWNKVVLENKEYYFDPTWNITSNEYLWLTKEEINKTHTIEHIYK